MSQATGILIPRGFTWDRSIPRDERRLLLDRILRLPAWLANDPAGANLDVKPLRGHDGLFRLRSGTWRALFQRLGDRVLLHRVDRRGNAYEEHELDAIRIVRSGEGLRPLTPARAVAAPEVVRRSAGDARLAPGRRAHASNPLTIFTDA